ncbi:MAG TPA: winged helix DNA-binding domain-containing protein [Microlunatus sp.]|nr:winged helix DNA-binding domain-containing protein [Microlunatus sp.]
MTPDETVALDGDTVLARRLATQRLVGSPLPTAAAVVDLLTCVQAQEWAHAVWSLGMRSEGSSHDGIVAAFDAGDLLRTHLLRPTWHLVAPADIGWILGATAERVHQKNAGMYRREGVDAATAARAGELMAALLEGGRALTRTEIGERLAAAGLEAPVGMRLTYLVMHAELEGLIVSGPMRGQQHTYALLAERLAGRPESTPDDPVAELWRRFVVGHGPTSVRDFARWSSLTLTVARAAAGRVADRLESAMIGEEELWWDPDAPDAEPAAAREAVRLLPLYDELPLSYPRLSFPMAAGHPHPPDDDLRWGSVIAGLGNVGVWRRTIVDGRRRTVRVSAALAPGTTARQRAAVDTELGRLAAFLDAEPVREEWNRR